MDDSIIQECGRTETLQAKQSFLASAIADISSYIHLVDTKAVSYTHLGGGTFFPRTAEYEWPRKRRLAEVAV